jgi:hypothetical protein
LHLREAVGDLKTVEFALDRLAALRSQDPEIKKQAQGLRRKLRAR